MMRARGSGVARNSITGLPQTLSRSITMTLVILLAVFTHARLSSLELREALASCLSEEETGRCACRPKCGAAEGPIHTWDTSGVEDFSWLVSAAGRHGSCHKRFNASLFVDGRGWNTSSGRWFDHMFDGASSFDQPVDHFDTSAARSMAGMFAGASAPSPHPACPTAFPGLSRCANKVLLCSCGIVHVTVLILRLTRLLCT